MSPLKYIECPPWGNVDLIIDVFWSEQFCASFLHL